MTISTLRMRQHDRVPILSGIVETPDGDPADLTGAQVWFIVRPGDGSPMFGENLYSLPLADDGSFRPEASVTNPVAGLIVYDWKQEETSSLQPGVYQVGAEVVWDDGRRLTASTARETELVVRTGMPRATLDLVPTTRRIDTVAPLTGGGDLSADRTLDISTFTDTLKGVVPPPVTPTGRFLKDDGTWDIPDPGETEDFVDIVATALAAGNNIDITYDDATGTITVDVEPLTTVDIAGLDTALANKQPIDSDLTAIAALAPVDGTVIQRSGGAWTAAALNLNLFSTTTTTPGIVPGSNGAGTSAYLNAAGAWTVPSGGGGTSGHASFTFNSNITEPVIGNQLRINNASQTAATRMWVSQTSTDGLDVTIALQKIRAGHQIYIQDFDDASKWVKYTVTADGVDDGTYFDFQVAYHSGPANVPFQTVELQAIAPGTGTVPPGGTVMQVLGKTSSADYAVSWRDPTWLVVKATQPTAADYGLAAIPVGAVWIQSS